jgi:hypothetical protein
MLTGTAMAADIQTAWKGAREALPQANPDPQALADLIALLIDCAERAAAIGFTSGEAELRRMARYLEGRISPELYNRYGRDGRIRH